MPIRSGRRLLGYVWIIAEREIGPTEHALLQRFAPDAAAVIEEERAGSREEVSAQRRLHALLSPDAAEACHAAAALVDGGVFRADQHFVVLIARQDDRVMDDAARRARRAWRCTRRAVSSAREACSPGCSRIRSSA